MNVMRMKALTWNRNSHRSDMASGIAIKGAITSDRTLDAFYYDRKTPIAFPTAGINAKIPVCLP